MRKQTLIIMAICATTLAGCLQTPEQRGIAGAVGGALLADALDENMVAGAAIGGLAGAVSCGVPGLPRCN